MVGGLDLEEGGAVSGDYLALHSVLDPLPAQDFCWFFFEFLQEHEGFFGAEAWDELQLALQMIVPVDFVDIQTHHIDHFDDHLF